MKYLMIIGLLSVQACSAYKDKELRYCMAVVMNAAMVCSAAAEDCVTREGDADIFGCITEYEECLKPLISAQKEVEEERLDDAKED